LLICEAVLDLASANTLSLLLALHAVELGDLGNRVSYPWIIPMQKYHNQYFVL
jgi:hypothetical protein